MGALNIQNVSLTEVVDQLARQLKLNLIYDVKVSGAVTLNTYGDTRDLDARNLLDQILRINGYGIVQAGELYHIVQLKEISQQPFGRKWPTPRTFLTTIRRCSIWSSSST